MKWIVFMSWLLLLRIEWAMHVGGFSGLHRNLAKVPVRPTRNRHTSPEQLCRAVDYACVFYFKPVLCLQRSAATTMLLRFHGWSAELVIGAQIVPFRSHAWVEVEGSVVNDKPYTPGLFQVLDRC